LDFIFFAVLFRTHFAELFRLAHSQKCLKHFSTIAYGLKIKVGYNKETKCFVRFIQQELLHVSTCVGLCLWAVKN